MIPLCARLRAAQTRRRVAGVQRCEGAQTRAPLFRASPSPLLCEALLDQPPRYGAVGGQPWQLVRLEEAGGHQLVVLHLRSRRSGSRR